MRFLMRKKVLLARRLQDKKGSQLLEFVLLSPIVLFLSLGMLIMALTIAAWVVVADAAREGSRAEALHMTSAYEKVKETIKGYGFKTSPERLSVVTSETDTYVTVTVQYKQPSFAPFLPLLLGGDAWDNYFTLTSRSTFKKEVESTD